MSVSLAVACLLALLGMATAQTYSGFGTAYSAPFRKDDTGFNACQFGELEEKWEIMYGAMNSAQYSGWCGKCIRVRGTEAGASGKAYLVKIVDRCPTCSYGDVDFSTTALEKITGFNWDHKAISWSEAPCDGPETASSEPAEEPEDKPEEESTPEEAATTKEVEETTQDEGSDGTAKPKGTYTNWVIDCEDGRARCSNLVLASMGYQCMNREKTHCCLQPNGKDCTKVENGEGDVEWDGDRRRKQMRKLMMAQ